ncbi:MAG: hypothetical protein ACRED5_00050 [Propylenella sp.]
MAAGNQELIKEQRERAYSLYEQSSKSLRLALIGVMGLAIVLFPLTFYPYAKFRGERYLLDARLTELSSQISSLQGDETELTELLRGSPELQRSASRSLASLDVGGLQDRSTEHSGKLAAVKSAHGGNEDVQRWLKGDIGFEELPRSLKESPHLQEAAGDPCFRFDADVWTGCALASQLEPLQQEASSHYAFSRISHLRNAVYAPLSEALSKLHADFSAWLTGQGSTWAPEGVRPNATFAEHYDAFIAAYLQKIDENHHSIVQQRTRVKTQLSGLEDEHESTDQRLHLITGKLDEIAALQDIETPFGKLPVGLNDLMLIFPILLAAGVLRLAHLQSETMEIRRVYHNLSHGVDPAREVLNDAHIALVAPLWIDPLRPIHRQILGLAILALPAVVFPYSIILLVQNRLLWGPAMDEVRLSLPFYIAAYLVMAAALAYFGFRVFQMFRRYRRSLKFNA